MAFIIIMFIASFIFWIVAILGFITSGNLTGVVIAYGASVAYSILGVLWARETQIEDAIEKETNDFLKREGYFENTP